MLGLTYIKANNPCPLQRLQLVVAGCNFSLCVWMCSVWWESFKWLLGYPVLGLLTSTESSWLCRINSQPLWSTLMLWGQRSQMQRITCRDRHGNKKTLDVISAHKDKDRSNKRHLQSNWAKMMLGPREGHTARLSESRKCFCSHHFKLRASLLFKNVFCWVLLVLVPQGLSLKI